MNEEDFLVGRCCTDKSKYLIYFNGKPSKNYAVYVCIKHFNKMPFNKNILKIITLERNN
ncbi:hypothetical protein [Candidatus Nitrosarchaeum limnium]|uniref:hypothetical protein n=1 Tax=Candidatus Nitrosarchaeum limnium TaxID=1007084 RepID=UPI001300C5F6|nr:hypothetical protein [Candidatus Nitrosarchaeum limnium]